MSAPYSTSQSATVKHPVLQAYRSARDIICSGLLPMALAMLDQPCLIAPVQSPSLSVFGLEHHQSIHFFTAQYLLLPPGVQRSGSAWPPEP